MGVQVRDIFVTLGFDVDNKDLDNLDRSLKNIQSGVKNMTILFAGASIAIGGFLKAAGDFEQVEIAFETMLGSAEKAKELLKDITQFAAKTPFSLKGIVASSKSLLAFKFSQEEIIKTMTNLGNIAAGVGRDKLPTLVRAFGKIRVKGKASMEELNMLLEAGVPILDELAKNFNVTTEELFKMITAGKVRFEDVDIALNNLSTGSGLFADLMEKQSKSFLGILSNIQDFLHNTAIQIGKELLPQAKAMANEFLTILETSKELIKGRLVKFFKSIAATMGILFKVAKAVVEGILNVTDAMGGLEEVIKAVAIAMIAFTGIQMLSAIGSITSAIFGLVKSMAVLRAGVIATQAAAIVMPILIGAAVIALGLIIEDIIGFFRGKDSITGLIIEAFEKKFPEAFLTTKAALFAIKETVGTVIDEFKLLFGFLDEFLIRDPLKAAKGIFSLDAFEGAAKVIFGDASNPATAPAGGGGGQGAQVNINAPVNVEVPAGTPPELVGESLTESLRREFGGMIRQASRATEPVTEF